MALLLTMPDSTKDRATVIGKDGCEFVIGCASSARVNFLFFVICLRHVDIEVTKCLDEMIRITRDAIFAAQFLMYVYLYDVSSIFPDLIINAYLSITLTCCQKHSSCLLIFPIYHSVSLFAMATPESCFSSPVKRRGVENTHDAEY